MSHARRNRRVSAVLALALACGLSPATATAQFFFRPFGYSHHYDLPPEDDYEAPRFGSRAAIARILSREGFRLVGPLGRRGDQVVATGINPREGEMRFFIDPFEGVILHGVAIGPPRGAEEDMPFAPGGDPAGARENRRAKAVAGQTPERAGQARRLARPAQPVETARKPATAVTPPVETAKPAEPPKPIEWAKPAEISKPAEKTLEKPAEAAKPPEPPKAADAAKPAESPRAAEAAKPVEAPQNAKSGASVAKAEKAPSKAPAPRATAARSTGASRRAIVPPPSEGTTVVTPSTPAAATAHAPAGAKTPQRAALPAAR